jgi:hypothetical protein
MSTSRLVLGLVVVVAIAPACELRRRVVIVTGTTLGLKATPGDGQSRPPQVTLGYKRGEFALVPTKGTAAQRCPDDAAATDDTKCTDAFSTLTAFDFRTRWFGSTELSSFVATGFAARDLQAEDAAAPGVRATAPGENAFTTEFEKAFRGATVGPSAADVMERRLALHTKLDRLGEDKAKARDVLEVAAVPFRAQKNPVNELRISIARASEDQLSRLEEAFEALGL